MTKKNVKIEEETVKFISSSMVPSEVSISLEKKCRKKVEKCSLGYIAGNGIITISSKCNYWRGVGGWVLKIFIGGKGGACDL